MKIAITGHSAGIGQAFAQILADKGHEIVGISKRDGNNIRVIPKITDMIESCDMFINNAQSGYAQTELLYSVWNRWQGQEKYIWCIGTIMATQPIDPPIPGQSELAMSEYRNQKIALEDAIRQLRWKKQWPSITLIRPGGVATQPGQQAPWPYCDVNQWAGTIVNTIDQADQLGMRFTELSLSATQSKLNL